ncbi:MAG: Rrf2 family transcriptional regulator [Cyanobacteria bacterium TGS_CYA1]|nr:Rrf2 family transcriptional regulator [Cyanobacteria bacterium TGS_CYA1]
MFSQTAEYALRAITFMSMHSDRPFSVIEIAEKTQIPQAYLAKVLQSVSRAGLVKSKRGLNGGFMLSIPPEQMTILDVINAVDPIIYGERCPLGLEMHGNSLCSIHEKLRIAYSTIEEIFSKTKISDLLEKPACTIEVRKRCSKKN